ncbi:CRISPR-associated endonuclease Cas6 [Desulfobacterales bacterium HSG2]|nr:CRISPR-associated endonuclease Cas6 [Desulfobacterales bacterium HSG2]
MKKATLFFDDLKLGPSQTHKLRNFIENLFEDYDVIHNDDFAAEQLTDRYPLIQFKLVNRRPAVPAVIIMTDKAVNLFSVIFMNLNKIVIDEIQISVYEKNLQIEEVGFGWSTETYVYEFISPWIGLNQINYQRYAETESVTEKNRMLKKALIRDILFMSEYLGYRPEEGQKINLELRIKTETIHLKDKTLAGFTGIFKTNFIIPDYLGIGKSVLQGFGTVKRLI